MLIAALCIVVKRRKQPQTHKLRMDNSVISIQYIQIENAYKFRHKKNETHSAKCTNLEHIMLSEGIQSQKATYFYDSAYMKCPE